MSASGSVSFDRIAGRYDATRRFPQENEDQIARGILAAVGGRMGTRFIEPGIGTGRIALPLLRQGVTYVGTDIAPLMLEQMRLKLQQEPWLAGRATLIEADAATLPLDRDSFDVALTAHLLHLLPDWRRAVDELTRVLRPGGCYVQASDNAGQAHAEFGRTWQRLADARGLAAQPNKPISDLDVLGHLGLPSSALTRFTLARWPNPATVAEMLRRFRDRESSQLWTMTDHDHAALMAELEAWATEAFGGFDRVLPAEASFHISVIRLG